MTSPDVVASPAHPLHNERVLHARPLRPGIVLEHTARFGEDRWSLRPALLQRHQPALVLNFEDIPARYRLVTKELFYTLLSGELPPGEPRLAMRTVHGALAALRPFLTWLQTRTPRLGRPTEPALAELTGADLADYQRHLQATVTSAQLRTIRRAAIRHFWRLRSCLISDRLSFDPGHLDGWHESRAAAPENATDRIPEAVHGPLLAWALRFVDDFAEDILAADSQWRSLRTTGQRHNLGRNDGAGEDIDRVLEDYLTHQRPLPGHRGGVNINFLAGVTGVSRTTIRRHRPDIDRVAAIVGVADETLLPVPVAGQLDGRPWLAGIVNDHRPNHGLPTLARMLMASAYCLAAFLSGMRDTEIKHLRRGCLRVEHDTHGKPLRWKVTSLAFKGENDPAGVEATWVIGAPAARAIQILQRLQPPETDLLFASLAHSPGNKPSMSATNAALSTKATNSQLEKLVEWINDYCTMHNRPDRIPLVNNRPWRPSTRQFRRTLAWFIARRPGGAIAGAIAYRHQAVQMFEGYAGTSDSGFRAEVESEQALARGEQLLAMIDAHEHKNLAGPASEEAAHRLDAVTDQAKFQGMVLTDEHRLQRLMKRDDPAIYPGRYVTCVHNHATALCQQRRDSRGELRPDLGGCRPLACRNVALTADNITAWHGEIDHIDQQLATRPRLPPLLRQQLQARRDEITTFLNRHTTESS